MKWSVGFVGRSFHQFHHTQTKQYHERVVEKRNKPFLISANSAHRQLTPHSVRSLWFPLSVQSFVCLPIKKYTTSEMHLVKYPRIRNQMVLLVVHLLKLIFVCIFIRYAFVHNHFSSCQYRIKFAMTCFPYSSERLLCTHFASSLSVARAQRWTRTISECFCNTNIATQV